MYEQGFTIIELMITLAVLAIIISMAAPSFVTMIQNNRATAVSNDLIASFQLARTEAIKRNATVSVQSTNDSTNWDGGHRIFIDPDRNGKFNAGELLLRNVDSPHSSITLTGTASDISYNNNGGVVAAATFTIDVDHAKCESGVNHKVNSVQLGLSGSITLTTSRELCP